MRQLQTELKAITDKFQKIDDFKHILEDCKLIAFMKGMLCNNLEGDLKNYDYYIKWLASIVQNSNTKLNNPTTIILHSIKYDIRKLTPMETVQDLIDYILRTNSSTGSATLIQKIY